MRAADSHSAVRGSATGPGGASPLRPGRPGRTGARRTAFAGADTVHPARPVTKGTVEEQIVALHHHKRDLAERLLEGADAPARPDAGELLELLRQPIV